MTDTTEPKVRKTREKLPELELDAIASVSVITTSQTMHRLRPQRAERSPAQKQCDNLVLKAYESWQAVGGPVKWTSDKPQGLTLKVRSDQVKALKAGIRNGGNHINVRIRFGLEVKSIVDGVEFTEFAFIATDRVERKSKTDDVEQ